MEHDISRWDNVVSVWRNERTRCPRCGQLFYEVDNLGRWDCFQRTYIVLESSRDPHREDTKGELFVRADHAYGPELLPTIGDRIVPFQVYNEQNDVFIPRSKARLLINQHRSDSFRDRPKNVFSEQSLVLKSDYEAENNPAAQTHLENGMHVAVRRFDWKTVRDLNADPENLAKKYRLIRRHPFASGKLAWIAVPNV